MKKAPTDLEVDWAKEIVYSGEESNPDFSDALSTLQLAIFSGMLDHAGAVAEVMAFPGPHHDAAQAYIFYFVAYAQDGFSVSWANQTDEPYHYLGPVGDFRNESMVSGLIQELGVSALPALDERAHQLLRLVA